MGSHCAVVALFSASSAAMAANLVVNGDFESGNTGFETQYSFAANCAGVGGEAIYTIAPGNCYGAGTGGPSGSGNVYFANGAVNTTQYVWRQTLTVQPNTKYYFSAHAATGVVANPPVLRIQVATDGACSSAASFTTIGTITASSTIWQWVQSSGYFTTNSAATTTCLRLMNDNPEANGNDYGLDDIVFDTVFAVTGSVAPSGGGTVTCTAAAPLLGGQPNEVLEGGSVTCTATPETGFTFANWGGNCSGTDPSCTLSNINANRTAVANFVAIGGGGNGGSGTPTPVPTMSEWAMMLMSGLLALLAVARLRKRQSIDGGDAKRPR